MPDADDFDVEYFRSLLQGNNPKDAKAPPAKPLLPVAKKTVKRTANPSATKDRGKSVTGRKKSKHR